MRLYELTRGQSPLVVSVPHAGTYVPDAIALRLSVPARAVPDTDWHVHRLYAFARDADATVLVATHSRYVVDLNRDPSGTDLYPGADNTELCPTSTFAREPLYAPADEPRPREIAARVATYWQPYHDALARELARVSAHHGHAVLLDGHSIPAECPRFFAGRLPDLNLGTADGTSCAPALAALATSVVAAATGFTHVVDGRFKGGYITRNYGRPEQGIHALQLEKTQACYMDEAPPYPWDASRAAPLVQVLERLVVTLGEWRPA